jgi:hypothetical protein
MTFLTDSKIEGVRFFTSHVRMPPIGNMTVPSEMDDFGGGVVVQFIPLI